MTKRRSNHIKYRVIEFDNFINSFGEDREIGVIAAEVCLAVTNLIDKNITYVPKHSLDLKTILNYDVDSIKNAIHSREFTIKTYSSFLYFFLSTNFKNYTGTQLGEDSLNLFLSSVNNISTGGISTYNKNYTSFQIFIDDIPKFGDFERLEFSITQDFILIVTNFVISNSNIFTPILKYKIDTRLKLSESYGVTSSVKENLNNVWTPSFTKYNKKLEEQLLNIEVELRSLKGKKDLSSKQQNLENLVMDLFHELNKKYSIIEIPIHKSNIFFLGDAGSGKTTLLKWIFTFLYGKDKIAAFVDLDTIVDKNESLESQLNRKFKHFSLKELTKLGIPLTLFIDDITPKTFLDNNVVKQLNELKSNLDINLVCCGRLVPETKNNQFNFETYKLEELPTKAVKQLFQWRLKKPLPREYLDPTILNILRRPLYLSLYFSNVLLADDSFNSVQVIDLSILFRNKSVFLNSILIESFLLKYERQKKNENEVWILERKKQIDILQKIAYKLIFAAKNTYRKNSIEGVIENKNDLNYIQPFINCNILVESGNKIVFNHSDFLYFFAARYINQHINNVKDFEVLRLKYEKKDSYKVWTKLESFLLGLLPPSKIISNRLLSEGYKSKPSIINELWIEKFELCFKLLAQRNLPENNLKLSRDDLINELVSLLNSNSFSAERYFGIPIWQKVLFKILNKTNLDRIYLNLSRFKGLKSNLNFLYINYGKYKGVSTKKFLLNLLVLPDLNLSLHQIDKVLSQIGFGASNYLRTELLETVFSTKSSIILNNEDKIKLVSDYIFFEGLYLKYFGLVTYSWLREIIHDNPIDIFNHLLGDHSSSLKKHWFRIILNTDTYPFIGLKVDYSRLGKDAQDFILRTTEVWEKKLINERHSHKLEAFLVKFYNK